MARHCAQCGAALGAAGNFCHACGAPRAGASQSPPSTTAASTMLPWTIAAIAVLSLVAFIVGQQMGRRSGGTATPPASVAANTGTGRAPDISNMSPQERADRLFARVMTYVSEGKNDSVQFFAPMAIQSFQSLAPLTPHQRYDLGLLGLVSGDGLLARAQADSILATSPTHLLGLILGMRAAGLAGDAAARTDFAARLTGALESEQRKRLPEYEDHGPDIDAALKESAGPMSARPLR